MPDRLDLPAAIEIPTCAGGLLRVACARCGLCWVIMVLQASRNEVKVTKPAI